MAWAPRESAARLWALLETCTTVIEIAAAAERQADLRSDTGYWPGAVGRPWPAFEALDKTAAAAVAEPVAGYYCCCCCCIDEAQRAVAAALACRHRRRPRHRRPGRLALEKERLPRPRLGNQKKSRHRVLH